MRQFKWLLCMAALLLCVALSFATLAEETGPLATLWQSGCSFLFHTDNVTVDGEAVFLLDGVQFKQAKLHYVQDGVNSLYDLQLLTPRADGTERQTGWTIIANKTINSNVDYYVMEAYTPGVYRSGSGTGNASLLRRTVQLDALTELGGALIRQTEPLLPEGVAVLTEQDDGKAVHVTLSEETIPDVAVSALNLAAEYLSNRWFSFGRDRSVPEIEAAAFDNYVTVTQALTDGTVRWALKRAEADFAIDAQDRLTGVSGEIQVNSHFWDGAVRTVTVRFSMTAKDYGTSHVKAFDPAEYNVQLPQDFYGDSTDGQPGLTDEEWALWLERTKNLLKDKGFTVSDEWDWEGWYENGVVNVTLRGEEVAYRCAFAEHAGLISLQQMMDTVGWENAREKDASQASPEDVTAAEALIRNFIKEQNPGIARRLGELKAQAVLEEEDGSRYISMTDEPQHAAFFVVQLAPVQRIVCYSGVV